jgi:O-antigen/teichoic acid export membrane protein
MRNNVRLIFLVGLGATGGLMALAQPIANAFFGPAFRPNAAPVIMVSAAAVFVGGMRSSYFEQIFEIALDTRPIAILTACRVVVTVVLSAPLIIRFGGIGGAYAALAVESVMLAATAIWARRFIDLPLPYASLAKISTAAVVMVGVLRLIPSRDQLLGLACAVVAGAVAYGAVVALLHVSALRAYLTLSRNAEAAGRS